MVINCIPLAFGDSFILQDNKYTILLDGGTSKSYMEKLRTIIRKLDAIDIWVVSHVHSDHIGGVLKYTDDLQGGLEVPCCNNWFFNPFQKNYVYRKPSDDGSAAESEAQGDRFYTFIKEQGFNFSSVANNSQISIGEFKITIVTPVAYEHNLIESEEDPSIAAAEIPNDYSFKIDDFDLSRFEEDQSIYNQACISLIVEYGQKVFFWTADSVPSEIIKGLRLLGYSEKNPLICDYMTLPHHGSCGNTNLELLSLIRCNTYIITANGCNKHNLPNKETIVRVLKNPYRNIEQHLSFLFPASSEILRTMFDVDDEEVKKNLNFRFVYDACTI